MQPAYQFAPRARWSRHQIRAYNAILPALSVAMMRNWTVAWVTLTTAEGGDASKLWRNHAKLQKWLQARSPYPVHWIGIRTSEGHGVLHVFWIFEGTVLLRAVCAWEAVKTEWERLHGAWSVILKHVGGQGQDALRLSRYAVGQYAAGQNGFLECRNSRQFMGTRDPKKIFAAAKRVGRDREWVMKWHFTSPMAREATIQLMMTNEWTYKGVRYVWTGQALEEG